MVTDGMKHKYKDQKSLERIYVIAQRYNIGYDERHGDDTKINTTNDYLEYIARIHDLNVSEVMHDWPYIAIYYNEPENTYSLSLNGRSEKNTMSFSTFITKLHKYKNP